MNIDSFIIFGNTTTQYAIACIAFAISILVLKLFQLIVLRKLKAYADKTPTDLDNALLDVCGHIKSSFYIIVSLYISLQFLTLPEKLTPWVNIIVGVSILLSVVHAASRFMDYVIKKYVNHTEEESDNLEHTNAMMRMIKAGIMAAIWGVVILLILANLGIDISSMIAGLGIGGIAIALALQSILSDIFSSFSIFIDKPFEVGDLIKVGSDAGVVEKIGLKTTRLRTLRGEELVISNKELTTARVQNFKKLKQRRETFQITIAHGPTQSTLKKIPSIVRQIVEKQDGVKFDRCHFSHFGESGLVYETVYHVESDNYKVYMSKKQQINLGIYTQFMKEDIEFAYPTQTIFIEKE